MKNTHAAKVLRNAFGWLGVDVARYTLDVQNETDRGCALVVGAWLEDALAVMLRADNGPNPAGMTFEKRTQKCLKRGIITRAESDNLDVFRDVRNRGAHLRDRKSGGIQWPTEGFDAKEIADVCDKLILHRDLLRAVERGTTRERFMFVGTVMLASFLKRAKKLPTEKPTAATRGLV